MAQVAPEHSATLFRFAADAHANLLSRPGGWDGTTMLVVPGSAEPLWFEVPFSVMLASYQLRESLDPVLADGFCGVSVAAITAITATGPDGPLVLSARRSPKMASHPMLWVASGGETVEPSDLRDGFVDTVGAGLRVLSEEFNIGPGCALDPGWVPVRVVGVHRGPNRKAYRSFVVADLAALGVSTSDVDQVVGSAKDAWEWDELRWLPVDAIGSPAVGLDWIPGMDVMRELLGSGDPTGVAAEPG